MSPTRLRNLHIKRVSLVDQGADQDAHIVLWKRNDYKREPAGMSAEAKLEQLAKRLHDRSPVGSLTREQAYDHTLQTPEGRELYARYRASQRSEVSD